MNILPRSLRLGRAFSLVEVLVALTIIAVVTFLAIPNIIQVKRDSEDGLARARADSLNVAVAAYWQAVGPTTALAAWSGAANAEARYTLIAPYLAFAPATLAGFMPNGYSVTFSTTEPHRVKATLLGPGSVSVAY
jgi:prepilin-type N-terminal cleavage/methylation domain-containing protein